MAKKKTKAQPTSPLLHSKGASKSTVKLRRSRKKIKVVMKEFKEGKLPSGSKKGPKVKKRSQAIAIALEESRKVNSKKKPKKK